MTGRYPHHIGTPYNLRDVGVRIDKGVPKEELFMSEMLQKAGYYTVAIGKWHMGWASGFRPNERGFDEFYGFLAGGHEYFPQRFIPAYEKQRAAGVYPIREYIKPLLHNDKEVAEKEYLTDAFTREAISVIKKSEKQENPFFLYLAYNAPHTPLQAKDEDLQKFSHIKDKKRQTYAAMVYAVDRGVKNIVAALKETNQFDNTLIVFFSDNGGSVDHGASNAPLKGTKGDTWEGGFRTPMFFHWPNRILAGKKVDTPVSALDLFPTFAHLAGAKLPKSKKLDGLNLAPVLFDKNEDSFKQRMIFSLRYREGYCDVGARKGDWKIVRMANEPWLLINIKKDMKEQSNSIRRYPEIFEQMIAETKKWSESHVKPLWYYSAKDEQLWNDGILPGYKQTFETEILEQAPLDYVNKKEKVLESRK